MYYVCVPKRSSLSNSGKRLRWSLFTEPKLLNSESMVVVLDAIDVLVNRAAAVAVSNDVLLELLPMRNFNLNGAIQRAAEKFLKILYFSDNLI